MSSNISVRIAPHQYIPVALLLQLKSAGIPLRFVVTGAVPPEVAALTQGKTYDSTHYKVERFEDGALLVGSIIDDQEMTYRYRIGWCETTAPFLLDVDSAESAYNKLLSDELIEKKKLLEAHRKAYHATADEPLKAGDFVTWKPGLNAMSHEDMLLQIHEIGESARAKVEKLNVQGFSRMCAIDEFDCIVGILDEDKDLFLCAANSKRLVKVE